MSKPSEKAMRKAEKCLDPTDVDIGIEQLAECFDEFAAEAMGEAVHVLERCQTVLGNMALENKGAIFSRWPINHEPLRADAKALVPIVAAAIAELKTNEKLG